jgi:hypothetical protein
MSNSISKNRKSALNLSNLGALKSTESGLKRGLPDLSHNDAKRKEILQKKPPTLEDLDKEPKPKEPIVNEKNRLRLTKHSISTTKLKLKKEYSDFQKSGEYNKIPKENILKFQRQSPDTSMSLPKPSLKKSKKGSQVKQVWFPKSKERIRKEKGTEFCLKLKQVSEQKQPTPLSC